MAPDSSWLGRVLSTACFVVFGLAACALLGGAGPRDMKFVSVEIVDLKNQTDIVWLSHNRPSWAVAKVTLSSSINLRDFVRRRQLNLVNDVSICDDERFDKARELQGTSNVYDNFGAIDAYQKTNGELEGKTAAAHTFHIYFGLKPIKLGGMQKFDYDLRRAPADVCVKLAGGDMFGAVITSNIVIVPKEVLAEAISRSTLK